MKLLTYTLFILASVTGYTLKGITKPLGYFDPLGFANKKSQNELIKLREAELKHGRWGMISAVGIPITELVTHKQAIHVLDNASPTDLVVFGALVAQYEFSTILLGWENPFTNSSNYFVMKSDYIPGDLSLGLSKSFLNKDELFMSNSELNHCRLAMIGSLGMIAQELASGKTLF